MNALDRHVIETVIGDERMCRLYLARLVERGVAITRGGEPVFVVELTYDECREAARAVLEALLEQEHLC